MPAKKNATKKRAMSTQHKAAIAEGRHEAAVVRRYLEALDVRAKSGSRRQDPERLAAKLQDLEQRIAEAPPVQRLQLIQQRIDTEAALNAAPSDELDELEAEFVSVAASYSARKAISYKAWRAVGVPAGVLTKAQVPRHEAG